MTVDAQLAGVQVLDFTIWRPGPYTTQLLSELGADVTKIEPPGGDPMRSYPGLFDALSARKRSMELDLKNRADRSRALELARECDVVVESYRPGVAARLGIDYETINALNPGVVYCSVSGLGQVGPLADAPGHDLNYQAWAATLTPEGGDPATSALPVADLAGGLAAAFAICASLVRAGRTGRGERIDCAITDVLATWTGAVAPAATGVDPDARGVPGYGLFETSDGGRVALGIITEQHFWDALCDALGLADARGLSFPDRMSRRDALQQRVAAAIAPRDRDDMVATLLRAGVPAAPVLSRAEMLANEHLRARGVVNADGTAVGPIARFEHAPADATPLSEGQ